MTGKRPPAGVILGNTAALALATAVAVSPLWPVYRTPQFITLVAVGLGLGSAIAILGALFRWPAWALLLATVTAYFLAGVPVAIPGEAAGGILPTGAGLGELAAATALSWKQLVTIVLPVGSYQALLVPAFILVLVVTVTGLSITLRARVGEFGVLAPLLGFVVAIGLGSTVAVAPVETGLALFVVVLFWLLWQRWARRRALVRLSRAGRSTRSRESAAGRRVAAARGVFAAAVIVSLAIGAGTAAAVAFPAQVPRDVVRARVQPPFDPRDYPSPLSEFRGYLQPARADTPMLAVTGLPARGRLRLAALDAYSGVVYGVDGAADPFTRLPDRLDQSQVPGDEVTVSVTVEAYSGVWVPGTGQLERIRFSGATGTTRSDAFYYNDSTGTAAVLGGLAAGDRYESTSVVPRAPGSLAGLTPGPAALPTLVTLPDAVEQALAGYVRAGDSPGVQLQDLIDGLKSNGYVSHGIRPDEPTSRSGHGLDRIGQLFTEVPMLGDAEQYAVAAALMARRLGFPARVVVGFVPKPVGAADTAPGAGEVTVHGSDLSAWIEVQSADDGWVTIDPNPAVRDVPARQPDQPTVVSRPQTVVPPLAPDVSEQRDPPAPENAVETPPAPLDPLLALLLTVLGVTGWLVLAAVVLLSPFLAVVVAKVRRRRLRQGRREPLERVLGGWREFADAATDFRVEVPAGATRIELAEAVGGMRPLRVAVDVDKAVFAPERPTERSADAVWAAVAELRTNLAAGRSRRERIGALVSLRSFARYAGGASVPRSLRPRSRRRQGGAGS